MLVRLNASAFVSDAGQVGVAARKIQSATSSAAGRLAGCAGMAGIDPMAEDFVLGAEQEGGYDRSMASMLQAGGTLAQALAGFEAYLLGLASGYRQMEIAGTESGANQYASLTPTAIVGSCPYTGSALGDEQRGTPQGDVMQWVEDFLRDNAGIVFPTADTGKVSNAASAWSDYQTALLAAQSTLDSALPGTLAATFPQSGDVSKVQAKLSTLIGDLADDAQSLNAGCTQYANDVESIRGELLSMAAQIVAEILLDVGIGLVLSAFTFGAGALVAAGKAITTVLKWVPRLLALVNKLKTLIMQAKRTMAVMRRAAIEAIESTVSGTIANATVSLASGNFSWQGLGGAAISSGIGGAISGPFSHIGSNIASRGPRIATRAGVDGLTGGAGGIAGEWVASQATGQDFNLLMAALVGTAGGTLAGGATSIKSPGGGGGGLPGGGTPGGGAPSVGGAGSGGAGSGSSGSGGSGSGGSGTSGSGSGNSGAPTPGGGGGGSSAPAGGGAGSPAGGGTPGGGSEGSGGSPGGGAPSGGSGGNGGAPAAGGGVPDGHVDVPSSLPADGPSGSSAPPAGPPGGPDGPSGSDSPSSPAPVDTTPPAGSDGPSTTPVVDGPSPAQGDGPANTPDGPTGADGPSGSDGPAGKPETDGPASQGGVPVRPGSGGVPVDAPSGRPEADGPSNTNDLNEPDVPPVDAPPADPDASPADPDALPDADPGAQPDGPAPVDTPPADGGPEAPTGPAPKNDAPLVPDADPRPKNGTEVTEGSPGGGMHDPEAPVRDTVPAKDAPERYTPEDVQQALDDAPRNENGDPVDHRNGRPLLLENAGGNRGWEMRYDPESGKWVAENRGSGDSDLPLKGEPGSYGYDENGDLLPYSDHRPEYAPGQVEQVWKDSRDQQLLDIEDGELDLPRPGPDQMWVKAHPDADPSGLHADNEGNRWRLIEWRPGEPRQGLWDMGHIPGEEYWKLRNQYLSGEIDLDDFLGDYRNSGFYEVADPSRNRAGVDELP